jgi:GNAT superfamily N-acetyltransferase
MSTHQEQPSSTREWHKRVDNTSYLISTDLKMIDHDFVNASFASPDMYWAKELPRKDLALMLEHSLTLGLYKHAGEPSSPRTPSPTLRDPDEEDFTGEDWEQIGLARFATDHVSFAFLTDVFINPDHRASGLGSWLIECCGEWMDGLPFLRRAMLMASDDVGKAYYAKAFGMADIAGEGAKHGLVCMTKTGPGSALGNEGKH